MLLSAVQSFSARRRRLRFAGLCGLMAALIGAPLGAQPTSPMAERFPAQAVTIVVPFPPGGSTDYVARTLGQALAEAWKVPVLVENRAGAAGNLGADHVARAPATGHTIMLGAVSMVTNPPLYRLAPYVPRVLIPIGVGVTAPLVTVARSDLPVKDIPALIALSRERAQGLNAASAGAGTLSHLGLEVLVADHKARLQHVPYKGSGPALTDLMGGQVDLLIDTVTSATSAIAAGKVKALAVHAPNRLAVLPEVPTFDEQGVRGMNLSAWNIFVVPAGTPIDRVTALHAALAQAIRDPVIAKALAERGLESIIQSPTESLESIGAEAQRWERVIRERGITL